MPSLHHTIHGLFRVITTPSETVWGETRTASALVVTTTGVQHLSSGAVFTLTASGPIAAILVGMKNKDMCYAIGEFYGGRRGQMRARRIIPVQAKQTYHEIEGLFRIISPFRKKLTSQRGVPVLAAALETAYGRAGNCSPIVLTGTAYGKLASYMVGYCQSGDLVYVTGQYRTAQHKTELVITRVALPEEQANVVITEEWEERNDEPDTGDQETVERNNAAEQP
jgi:hypothetical protein